MSDSHTKMKLWSHGYSSTVPLQYANLQHLQLKKYYLSSEPNKAHNCKKGSKKTQNDNDWLVFLLSFGLEQTVTGQSQVTDLRNGNILLRHAKLENDIKLSFPKSVCAAKEDTIVVADTGNNRVIGFNLGGVQTFIFDKFQFKGEMCYLFSPLSVCGLRNGNIAICNYGNSTINIITLRGSNRLMFPCTSKPIYIDSDHHETIFVLTETGEIEEMSKSGKIIRITKINNNSEKIYTLMAVSSILDEIFLGKCNSTQIFVITKCGKSLRYMSLNIPDSGLSIFLSNILLDDHGDILVADSVNRSVYLFNSNTGEYKSTIINGKSGLGCVQAVCLTKESYLITSEYSLNQSHCVKIFSYTHDIQK